MSEKAKDTFKGRGVLCFVVERRGRLLLHEADINVVAGFSYGAGRLWEAVPDNVEEVPRPEIDLIIHEEFPAQKPQE